MYLSPKQPNYTPVCLFNVIDNRFIACKLPIYRKLVKLIRVLVTLTYKMYTILILLHYTNIPPHVFIDTKTKTQHLTHLVIYKIFVYTTDHVKYEIVITPYYNSQAHLYKYKLLVYYFHISFNIRLTSFCLNITTSAYMYLQMNKTLRPELIYKYFSTYTSIYLLLKLKIQIRL